MSTNIEPPPEPPTEEMPTDPLAFRRIWTNPRGQGQQAASSAVLKAFGVLYDAGRPLTRAELLEGLLPRLDAYETTYLQAWDARHRGQILLNGYRRLGKAAEGKALLSTVTLRDNSAATDRWLSVIFDRRRYGGTLIRDKDDRYRPGPRAPRMQTAAGLVPFTPETRLAQDIADRDASQQHAMEMEWRRVQSLLEPLTDDRLLVLVFLARRYAGFTKTEPRQKPLSETTLRSLCHHLLRANRPAVQRAILETVLNWAYASAAAEEQQP